MADSKQQQIYNTVESNTVNMSESKSYIITKRVMDIILSLIGLLLLLPVLVIIAFIIKLEDRKGTIVFKQVRVGKEGRTFEMYKFRSMVSNAEEMLDELLKQNEANGPNFKMKDDPRITKIGRVLRKTSLDELPQLLNVLKGDMSLVGPRPALIREVEKYTPYQLMRLEVTPGLTCYWQVGGRSNLTFDQQIELDLQYIKTRNILVDFKLILKTIKVLFGSKDAY